MREYRRNCDASNPTSINFHVRSSIAISEASDKPGTPVSSKVASDVPFTAISIRDGSDLPSKTARL